jgi:hypothetical protein
VRCLLTFLAGLTFDRSIIRGTDYLFRSEEQQHSFNYPMQVGTQSRDTAKKDAQRFDVKVQKDDVSRATGFRPRLISVVSVYRSSFCLRTA